LRVAKADQTAFSRLYASASPTIFGVLVRMFDDHAAAEDALQEAFVRIWHKASSYDVYAYCGGYSHQELCDLTGRALGTIKSWIRRSLNSLRECVDELA